MAEYFIWSNSFAAPFFSDSGFSFWEAESPVTALEQFVLHYKHPAGLYAAQAYDSADAYYKGAKPIARWVCNHDLEKQRLTKDLQGYSYLSNGPGDFKINGERYVVADPKGGSIVDD